MIVVQLGELFGKIQMSNELGSRRLASLQERILWIWGSLLATFVERVVFCTRMPAMSVEANEYKVHAVGLQLGHAAVGVDFDAKVVAIDLSGPVVEAVGADLAAESALRETLSQVPWTIVVTRRPFTIHSRRTAY